MRRWGLAGLYWGTVVAMGLPLGLIALTSLSAGPIVAWPVGTVSLRWYAAAFHDPAYRGAFVLSAMLAAGAAAAAVAAGTWIALAGRPAATTLAARVALLCGSLVPLVTPGIVHAIALRIAIRSVGLAPGWVAVLVGHAIHATPYAAIMVGARLAAMPPGLLDAARDLGAGPIRAFAQVTLPWLRPALTGAGLLAALTSFDDFIRSFFLGGYDPTLPVLIFGRLRSGLTPEINAVATIVMVGVFACACAASRDRGRR